MKLSWIGEMFKIDKNEICNRQDCEFIIDDSYKTGICYGKHCNRDTEFICDYNALKQLYGKND